ncbi:MAG: restriction endonuclease subunit S [Desulfobacter postgatei]|uniref:restriction endonuclease subunit S n=1 Tax=Desulfobacter postgatei TaxID=2293 RepID=UPI0023F4C673|nr:restriction endonuclease subunit S [Desulfobacter postgatei]MDD4274223.1 restriction endonuclease subunit S [Desulfobacter postgatei]
MGDYLLSDIAEIVDCEHKTAPTVEMSDFYSIRTTDVTNGKIDFESANRVAEHTFLEWTKRAVPMAGDIILAREAPVGEVGWIKEGYRVCLGQRTVLIKPRHPDVFNRYLLYYFVSPDIKHELRVRSTGSVVSHLNMKDIRNFEITLPNFPEQKAIASVLSSLDDKIDLLHRQNKTLEAMAETFFRQWFVEEAGEDWENGNLLEIIDLVGGGTPKTSISEYWDGSIPWLSGGDIASNHKSFVQDTPKHITEHGLRNSAAKLLPKHATVISARGTVGKYCMLAQPMAFSQSNYGILPKNSESYYFTYLLINHVVEELQSSAYGSVFDTITTTTFKEHEMLLPPRDEIIQFNNSVSGFFEKMLLNEIQIRTLEKLRDTLLPKLMSGEVSVEL